MAQTCFLSKLSAGWLSTTSNTSEHLNIHITSNDGNGFPNGSGYKVPRSAGRVADDKFDGFVRIRLRHCSTDRQKPPSQPPPRT